MAKPNYTEEETATLKKMYAELGNKGLDKIAATLQKPVPSVRSKLIKEGVYVVEEKKPARKNGPTKKELLENLRQMTGGNHDGLNSATKEAIEELIALFQKKED